ncbi:free fatty acid receptor 2-like [Scleropages formosus]|nr:free fatty acid receptor 2-like [Scleropages formosus]
MLSGYSHLVLAVHIITFLTGLPTNILAFYTFSLKVRQKPAPIDILLLNLTVSDLIFLIFLPFRMKEAADGMKWYMPDFLCPLSGFLFYATIYNSTFFLTGVSVERYLGVAYPIRHKLSRRPLYAVIASIFFWVFSLTQLSIVYIVPYYNPQGDGMFPTPVPQNICYENFTNEQLKVLLPVRLELCLVLFCIPFLICSFCYINFVRILCKLPHISRRRRQRAIGLSLGTLVVFVLCFGPYNVSHVVGFATDSSPYWRNIALIFSTFNACLDPFIFYFSSSAVRKALRRLFANLLGRLKVPTCNRPSCCSSLADSQTDKDLELNPNEGSAV